MTYYFVQAFPYVFQLVSSFGVAFSSCFVLDRTRTNRTPRSNLEVHRGGWHRRIEGPVLRHGWRSPGELDGVDGVHHRPGLSARWKWPPPWQVN